MRARFGTALTRTSERLHTERERDRVGEARYLAHVDVHRLSPSLIPFVRFIVLVGPCARSLAPRLGSILHGRALIIAIARAIRPLLICLPLSSGLVSVSAVLVVLKQKIKAPFNDLCNCRLYSGCGS